MPYFFFKFHPKIRVTVVQFRPGARDREAPTR